VPRSPESSGELLRWAGVQLGAGLSAEEVAAVEARFGFRFLPEHRDFLRRYLPAGPGWPDWRAGDATRLEGVLGWPVEGALFDVEHEQFWPRSWGPRPAASDDALRIARRHLDAVPKLVPVYGHRYLPASPAPSPSPVFSVHQTDVIYYGADLADYLAHEFGEPAAGRHPTVRIPFWSDLAEGVEDVDL
jgi:hypothetical protein